MARSVTLPPADKSIASCNLPIAYKNHVYCTGQLMIADVFEMKNSKTTLHQRIQSALLPLDLAQVLLFGSYARGAEHAESDLDIIVVLDDARTVLPFGERVRWIRRVRQSLESCGLRISMDILVYTAPQWEHFLASNSSFLRELRDSAIKIA